ncbi:hypothetical protein CCR75_004739 [Bremia lactucae]|uniref:Uncharacterized protein n=1 Tax=Bremia lactucae TaxID=4779 RepID=A0A976NZF2_BRELC|nr:hypothetical protein CCR75_004739 [Bremia lactucae]
MVRKPTVFSQACVSSILTNDDWTERIDLHCKTMATHIFLIRTNNGNTWSKDDVRQRKYPSRYGQIAHPISVEKILTKLGQMNAPPRLGDGITAVSNYLFNMVEAAGHINAGDWLGQHTLARFLGDGGWLHRDPATHVPFG